MTILSAVMYSVSLIICGMMKGEVVKPFRNDRGLLAMLVLLLISYVMVPTTQFYNTVN